MRIKIKKNNLTPEGIPKTLVPKKSYLGMNIALDQKRGALKLMSFDLIELIYAQKICLGRLQFLL